MTSDGRDDDDGSAEPADDAARAEHAWLITREANPDAPPPSAQVAADYARIEAMLADLPEDAEDDSWRAEVLRRANEMSTPRVAWWRRPAARWAAIGGGAVLAAAVVLLLLRPPPPAAELAFHFEHTGTRRSNPDDAVVHDKLIAPLPRGARGLFLFRPDGKLVADCPGGPGCSQTADGAQLEVELDAAGKYYIYLVTAGALPPFDGTMRGFNDQVRSADAHTTMMSFDVH